MPDGDKILLKIGLVLDTSLDPPDGVQQYIISLGKWLREQGHEVHYLVGQTVRRDLPNIHSLSRNISVQSNGNRTTIPLPSSRHRLHSFLDAESFDVLHVQMPYSPFMAKHLINGAGHQTAIIGTFHIAPYTWLEAAGTKLLGVWLKRSLKRFDKVVSVSPAAAKFARRSFKIETAVLPNVIDYQLFHSAKAMPEYDDNKPTIIFLGRLVRRKGCQILLEAINELATDVKTPKFRVVIAGKGPLYKHLRNYIVKHDLESIVELRGFISEADKPAFYASADLSVFPSSGGESFGIVLLEAMASGQATVLAGDNPGYQSVMSPQPELLFAPHDYSLLAKKIKSYLIDDSQRRAMAKWGEDYSRQFDVNKVGKQLLEIYSQALRKRRNL